MKTYFKLSANQWVWGTSAHWRLYYSLKTFGRRCSSYINAVQEVYKKEQYQDSRRRPHSSRHSRRFRHTSTPDHFSLFPDTDEALLLSNDKVNEIIRENEVSIDFSNDESDEQCVLKCEINQLGSNEPNEDQVFVTKSSADDGILFGVLDGHGGALFGEYVKARLPYYMHTSLANKFHNCQKTVSLVENLSDKLLSTPDETEYWIKNLENYMEDLLIKENSSSMPQQVLSYIKTPLNQICSQQFPRDVEQNENETKIHYENAIKEAFTRLDNDMIKELIYLANEKKLSRENVGFGTSGCCALIGYLLGKDVYIANLGDCRAVLGSYSSESWTSTQLTHDHTSAGNSSEVQRILAEHPPEESRTCLSYGRLLGRLAPLRALGDFQFKLPNEDLVKIFQFLPKYSPFSNSLTPPYLTSEPEVFHYKLNPNDHFIVMASDGLWDMLSNDEVVKLVSSYIENRQIDVMKEQAHFYSVPNCDQIKEDSKIFDDSLNENVASFLIRQALGGYDQGNLKYMLSMKHPDVRLYRDDISVVVVFFKQDNN